jgi:hypothetical protein
MSQHSPSLDASLELRFVVALVAAVLLVTLMILKPICDLKEFFSRARGYEIFSSNSRFA